MRANERGSGDDLNKAKTLRGEDIDYSEIPDLSEDEQFWANAELVVPEKKAQITLRLDSDVLEWFKSQGKGYQTRINSVLRTYKQAHSEKR